MGRLRANLTNSVIDSVIHREVESAKHALERAMRACRSTKTGSDSDVSAARLRRVIRDLGRAHYALSSVGSVASPYGSDPVSDKDPQREREQYWAKRRAEEEERKAAEAAALVAEMAVAEAAIEGGE